MTMTMMTNHFNIFWPTTKLSYHDNLFTEIEPSSFNNKEPTDFDSDYLSNKNGYVIGWDDDQCCIAATTSTTSSSDGDGGTNNKSASIPGSKRMIICAGIVSGNDVYNGSASCSSLEQIQKAIQSLKDEYCKNVDCCCCFTDNGADRSSNHSHHSNCHTFLIIQKLKIVAKYIYTTSSTGSKKNHTKTSENHSSTPPSMITKDSHDDHLPIITIQSKIPHVLDIIQYKDKYRQPISLKLVLFEPCPHPSFDHYNHSLFDTSYYALFTSNNNDNNASSFLFTNLLTRLSETETVLFLLKNHLHSMKIDDPMKNRQFSRTKNNVKRQCDPRGKKSVSNSPTVYSFKQGQQQQKQRHQWYNHNNYLFPSSSSSSLTLIYLIKRHQRYILKKKYNHSKISMIFNYLIIYSPMLYFIFHPYLNHDKTTKDTSLTYKHYITKKDLSNQSLHQNRLKYASLSDGIIGILLSLFIIYNQNLVISTLQSIWNGIHGHLLRQNIGWLETFPAGMKLNVPLTKVMGKATLWMIGSHDSVLQSIFVNTNRKVMLPTITSILATFGFKFSCALCFDLTRLITIHIYLMSRIFQKIYQIQLSLFSSLWHLFRGKKKNVLRKRSDTLEFDFMQLLLGMILFIICLFLFTTIFVYYSFFTCIYLIVTSCVTFLWSLYLVVDILPVGDVIEAIWKPRCFRTTVKFVRVWSDITTEENEKEGTLNEEKHCHHLVSSHLNPISISVQVLTRSLLQFVKRFPRFIGEILSGESCSILMTALEISAQL